MVTSGYASDQEKLKLASQMVWRIQEFSQRRELCPINASNFTGGERTVEYIKPHGDIIFTVERIPRCVCDYRQQLHSYLRLRIIVPPVAKRHTRAFPESGVVSGRGGERGRAGFGMILAPI